MAISISAYTVASPPGHSSKLRDIFYGLVINSGTYLCGAYIVTMYTASCTYAMMKTKAARGMM